jgi:hypothetical protein
MYDGRPEMAVVWLVLCLVASCAIGVAWLAWFGG